MFIRFIDDKSIVEDFLAAKNCQKQDIFDVIISYLEHCELKWKNCVGICTDGASSMTGCLKGFVFIAQKQNSTIIHTHCFIHREALVAKTFTTALNSVLDMVAKLFNYIKMRPLQR